ncbi:MAG: hypothetical protein HUU08_12555 [Candidatus Brocadia sp.]|nr:hypothetical protein [Candidatus Brocadia sp.]
MVKETLLFTEQCIRPACERFLLFPRVLRRRLAVDDLKCLVHEHPDSRIT